MTTDSPPCITATTELVVPKSIPMILLIAVCPPGGRPNRGQTVLCYYQPTTIIGPEWTLVKFEISPKANTEKGLQLFFSILRVLAPNQPGTGLSRAAPIWCAGERRNMPGQNCILFLGCLLVLAKRAAGRANSRYNTRRRRGIPFEEERVIRNWLEEVNVALVL